MASARRLNRKHAYCGTSTVETRLWMFCHHVSEFVTLQEEVASRIPAKCPCDGLAEEKWIAIRSA